MPDFEYEIPLWEQNKLVAGADEVGRGALAGPVVCAVVVLLPPVDFVGARTHATPFGHAGPALAGKVTAANHTHCAPANVKIDDSKRLTREQREIAEKWIIENSLTWGIGESSVSEINKLGIIGATNRAYRRAIYSITGHNIDHLLIDGFAVPRAVGFPKKRQTAIIRGDQKSFSIAAASIIAKVYRDNLMKKLSGHYKHYHWHSNVGYGTKVHRDAIIKHGVTAHHRELFVRNFT